MSPGSVAPGPRTRLLHRQRLHSLQLRLGIDKEVGCRRDLVTGLESCRDLHHLLGPHADAHFARLEIAVSFIDIGYLPQARIYNRILGNGQFSPEVDLQVLHW